MTIGEDEDSFVIFKFLETLPNLRVLDVVRLHPACLSRFISSIQHTDLLELVLKTDWGLVKGPPTAGIAGLEKLSINWHVYDYQNEPGNSLAHLYEFIRPTLTTLVELRIFNEPGSLLPDLDLQLLKPAAHTLRTFEYTLQSNDESVLDTIPVIFPNLTKLSINWENTFTIHSVLWKACTNFPISHS